MVLLLAGLVWLALASPREKRSLDGAAEHLQAALEENPVCAVLFGLEELPTRL